MEISFKEVNLEKVVTCGNKFRAGELCRYVSKQKGKIMPQFTGGSYRKRSWFRSFLPWFIIDLGIADKGQNCELKGGNHEWYNSDNKNSGCYHCRVVKSGQLWKR